MKIVKIKAYKFQELNDKAILNALTWLDSFPLDYEDNDGKIKWEYLSDIYYESPEPEYVAEHCENNQYLFDEYGNTIHQLID